MAKPGTIKWFETASQAEIDAEGYKLAAKWNQSFSHIIIGKKASFIPTQNLNDPRLAGHVVITHYEAARAKINLQDTLTSNYFKNIKSRGF